MIGTQQYLEGELDLFQLPSMKDSTLTRNYLYNKKDDIIYEISKIQKFGSYLVGDYLIAVHKVHIIFLALPYLTNKRGKVDSDSKGKMCELNEIFSSDDCKTENERNGLNILKQCPKLADYLKQICEITEKKLDGKNYSMVRLNDEKLHAWLDQRLERLREAAKNRIPERIEPNDENGLNLLAFEFLYEYVADYLLESFMLKYNLTVKAILQRKVQKRQYTDISKVESPAKGNSQTEEDTPPKSIIGKAKKAKTSGNLAKAAKNTQILTSLFYKSTTS